MSRLLADPRPRYAIYYAPREESALWRFGCAWLGRDPLSGQAVPQPRLDGLSPDRIAAITRTAASYGFHATFKPPFRLAQGETATTLAQTARAFAASQPIVALPPLNVADLSGFLALTLSRPCAPLHALADACVRAFDPFRAAPSPGELARRRAAGLSERQEALLMRWGYPYVLDEWTFHMTLTESLDPGERAQVSLAIAPLVEAALREEQVIDAVSLFRQDGPGEPFNIVSRFPFGG